MSGSNTKEELKNLSNRIARIKEELTKRDTERREAKRSKKRL